MGDPTSKRRRVIDRVRVLADTVKWSYLEMEDDLKCRFWKLFSGSRSRCNSSDCRTCNPKDTEASGVRDGRFSTLLQKIRTWPRFGSRRIRDHTSQDAQQAGPGPTSQHDRIKAASFPAKHRDLSRARFLPRVKKFESIREETNLGGSFATPDHLAKDNEPPFMNVVGVDIGGNDTGATTSVEDLEKYSYSFGSDLSFGNRDDSMTKDLSIPQHIQSSTPGVNIPSSAGNSEVSESAGPATQSYGNAWDFHNSSPIQNTPASAVSSEVSDSAGPASQAYDSAWHSQAPELIESPIPETCASSEMEAIPQSRFDGVRWKAKKWTSEIRPAGAKRTVWLGTYATEEEAASAFDAGIFYYNKPKNYNFPDAESHLPQLNRSMDEKAQLNFIKTQARLIAKTRARLMADQAAVTNRDYHPANFNPGTPDTSSSRAGHSRSSFFPTLKRAKSGDAGLPKNCRRKY